MYERSIALLNSAFENYSLIKIDENMAFMCGDVLCKVKKSHNLVVNSQKSIRYEVEPVADNESNADDGLKGKLKIYDKNDLIFEENLYSI